jgi:THO complex subunit 1
VRDVQNVDLDIEMANTDEVKKQLDDQKMSKTWRALRLMSKTKLNLFDKVDDGKNLECFVQTPEEEGVEGAESAAVRTDELNGQVEHKLDDEAMADVAVPRIAAE